MTGGITLIDYKIHDKVTLQHHFIAIQFKPNPDPLALQMLYYPEIYLVTRYTIIKP